VIYPVVIDFETDGIKGNPLLNPPLPCGVSIKWPGGKSVYFAWGHPTGNNCSLESALSALEQVVNSGLPMLFHNSGFDISVWASMSDAFARFWKKLRNVWDRIHDTLYLVFFADPYAPSFSLKPSAERWLNWPPEEQDALKAWILAHVPEATVKDWAAYISRAPGDVVAPYACGDTDRTDALFQKLYEQICSLGMLEAYNRERRMFPVTFEGTRRGVRCDREQLITDEAAYTRSLDECEGRLCTRLSISPHQLEEDEEALKDGLERSGAVIEWVRTPKSKKRSLAQGNLKIVIPEIRDLLDYRGALKTSLQTFVRPWIEFSRGDGRLHPNWNQVRQAKGDWGSKGARTGRLSSDDPNLMNLPTSWEYKDGTPMSVPEGLLPYPNLRRYILPEAGHMWLKRDFSSQEIRITAHFEDGTLKQAYVADPSMDPHELARKLIQAVTGLVFARVPVKITGFSIIYGAGAPGLSAQLGCEIELARHLKSAYLASMPGVADLMTDVQNRGRAGLGVRTWGGRIYQSEPPKMVDGRMRDFHYKLLNYLVQGSAADQTKDCINEWDEEKGDGVFLATVHDEINISAPTESWQASMTHLRRVMERDRFDVPFKSEGFVGPNWGTLEACA
jgi:DNA polymerase I-like protein with 3'-5' exonuclease and polymerase domains